ncbi:amidophosphoribosyltransferase [Acidipropionibacterium jensenii]|uniref:Amidophosphoribosyltransferase n=4 Tax=Acidipropionibacterium jensenii TaxID=1749 RepID=A0A3T0RXR3_9ACTN|nr:amidophosphoribosyltransferase [Acidipropionibacterium jensenii]AZZ38801.1 amidophosphoribosyltransferase [Acidipropionibacterium jensenii]MDN5977242.1 amidophosphoribosyltransferase [Acidipropionibacterium jensenii]MDN6020556.1 amidophosphoribosyltransferase [Acidipropionibacterium jensenii]MDN6426485.1 amidophosphoribosyltransferase [Acidipropionibacterium jensenii]MDN6512893.1 amidophosphoribosyltransferase [Acidipropionibacterium jensenii]
MTRADGHLTADLDPQDHGPQDACGVIGVYAPGEEVATLVYFGMYALQHRGQESAGMAVSDGRRTMVFKDMGLVSQVFDGPTLDTLKGSLAIGHTRYSTTGSSVWDNAQPTFRSRPGGGGLALAHNGNLTNSEELEELIRARDPEASVPHKERMDSTSDTALMSALMATYEGPIDEIAMKVLPVLKGAFSIVFMDDTMLCAARDPQGIRPLVLGRLETGWVVASETAAIDIVGGTFVREVEPGELITISAAGLRSARFATARPKGCIFEYVYLARPDTIIANRRIHNVRVKVGKILAQQAPVDADLVIPVPESGTPAAIGYADESGIKYGMGLVKNSYVGRTFIQPSQTLRNLGIRLKLNPLRDVIEGKRLVVVDDSIVRGNTQRQLVAMLRQAGAKEVHVRISSPPVKWPCFYGIDFATRAQLIAAGLSVEEIAASIGADSLAYVSLEGLIQATHVPKDDLCRACFDGVYPVQVPPEADHLLADSPSATGRDHQATLPEAPQEDPS